MSESVSVVGRCADASMQCVALVENDRVRQYSSEGTEFNGLKVEDNQQPEGEIV